MKRKHWSTLGRRDGGRAAGDPVIAYYDAPVVPPPLRRNEVLMRVE